MVGGADATMTLAAALLEQGVLAHGIRPPTVPEGTARIRATVMATHTDADIDAAVAAFECCATAAHRQAPPMCHPDRGPAIPVR
jgi:7-keto-8-aminopelargonate synthetase-like enzyme